MAKFEVAGSKKDNSMEPQGSDRIKGRPPVVHRAVVNRDVAYLSVAGKKGAEVTKEVKANKAAEKDYYAEKRAAEHAERARQANEHIVPINRDEKKEAA